MADIHDIQIILVEADQPTRIALRTALRSQEGIEVASEATNGETGLVLLESIDVDVAVVDAHLPDMDLGTFVRQMRAVQAESFVTPSKLLVLVNPEQDLDLMSIIVTGAEAYCSKQTSIEQLADAVRQAMAGEIYVDPALEFGLNCDDPVDRALMWHI
jgi:anaerobic magnesium-protoporphyrin IX monomethyl ester cyclase